MNNVSHSSQSNRDAILVTALACAIVLLYGAGTLFSDSFLWGVHQLAFLSTPVQIGLLVVVLVLILVPSIARIIEKRLSPLRTENPSSIQSWLIACGAGALSIALFSHFKIAVDIYGDTRTLLDGLARHSYTVSEALFSKETEPLTRFLHQQFAGIFGAELATAISVSSIMCGAIVVVLLIRFVQTSAFSAPVQWLFLVSALTMGANQLFYGHIEDYTYLYVVLLTFLIVGWRILEGKQHSLWLLFSLLVIGIRLHAVMGVFIPAFAYLIVRRMKQKKNIAEPDMKNVGIAVLATLAVATAAYFFYFKAYTYSKGDESEIHEKIFLPVFNALPSPHTYTLLSFTHANDVLQTFLYILSPGIVLMLCFAGFSFRRINFNEPKNIFFGLASLYAVLFCATVNPLLSFVRDWDLMAFAGLPLLFFALSLLSSLLRGNAGNVFVPRLLAASIGLAALSCSMVYINATPEPAYERVRYAGRAMFKGFYGGSSYIINVGEKGIEDPEKELAARKETISLLQPYAGEQDGEMSNLTTAAARLAMELKQYRVAQEYYTLSLRYDSLNATAIKFLALCSMMERDYRKASDIIDYYNEQVNSPEVFDPNGLMIAQFIGYIMLQEYNGVDSVAVRQKLDMFISRIR